MKTHFSYTLFGSLLLLGTIICSVGCGRSYEPDQRYINGSWDIFDAVRRGTLKDVKYCVENRLINKADKQVKSEPLGKKIDFFDTEPEPVDTEPEPEFPSWDSLLFATVDCYYSERDSKETLKIIEYLITAGANVNARINCGGNCRGEGCEGGTLLHYVVLHTPNNSEQIMEILIANGADVKAKGCFGYTPLHIAVVGSSDNTKRKNYVVKLLIENGADINARDNTGQTALHRAVYNHNNDESTVRYLVENGADVNAKDRGGNTPLHNVKVYEYKYDGNNNGTVSIFLVRELVQYLIANGADVNAINDDGNTAETRMTREFERATRERDRLDRERKVRIGASVADVISVHGEPSSRSDIQTTSGESRTILRYKLNSGGVVYQFENGRVTSITVDQ